MPRNATPIITPSASPAVPHAISEPKVLVSIFEQLDQLRKKQAKDRAKTRNDEINNSLLNNAFLDFSHQQPLSKVVKPVYDRVIYQRIDHVRSKALQCIQRETDTVKN